MVTLQKEEIINLIKMYEQRDCLWNFHSPYYKDVDMKKEAWEEIAEEFDISVEGAKKKVKALRSTYLSEKKKVETMKNSGTSSEEAYTPNLFYYDEFKFLDSAIYLRKSYDNLEITPNPTKLRNLTRISSTDKHKTLDQPKTKKFEAPIQEPSVNLEPRIQNQDDEWYFAFAKSIALQLKQMPPIYGTKAMADIQNVCSKHLSNYLSSGSSYTSTKNILQVATENAEIFSD